MNMILSALLATTTWASAPYATGGNPGYYRLKVGKVEITAISDGTVELPMGKLLTKESEKDVKAALKKNFLDEKVETSFNAFLLNTGSKLVLVDSGAGAIMGAGAGQFFEHLKNSGYKPEQIDAVVITHLHGDHIGALSVKGKIQFPNATLYVGQADLDFWFNKEANAEKIMPDLRGMFDVAKAAVTPYKDAKKLIALRGATEITPEIHAEAAPGHTPGHMVFTVESEGQKIVMIGDLVHAAAVQFENPTVSIQFDVDQKSAEKERKVWFAKVAKEGDLIAAAHLPFPGIGHVRADKKNFAYVPVNYSR